MEKHEEIQALKAEARCEVLKAVILNYEDAVEQNDSEMVSAFAESLKAVFMK
ncbi:hypothetical protein [Carnobacterium maltaromaticum]|uniref:hypothetical protein n=1 Tax=Carnobacterium maltaromaticum TaxID=2751 RepID=UPI0039BE21FA